MKIQLASDLHLEFLARRLPGLRLVEPTADADVLVLAGDIGMGTQGVDMFADLPIPVIYVAGNHEFYGREWSRTRAELRAVSRARNVHFLDNDEVVIDGVRFLGATLWTDFRHPGTLQSVAMKAVELGLMDYRFISTSAGPLQARQTLEDHERSRAWLQQRLGTSFDGPTVVVSHHGPHPLSIHPRYAGNALNPGFVSDLTPLVEQANLWLHGHVHDSFDYRVGKCRVVANPAGYVLNLSETEAGASLRLENAAFNPSLLVEATGGSSHS